MSAAPAGGFRVPLHFKVMVSYLGVVGLVLLPTLIYLRTIVRDSMIDGAVQRLGVEADALAGRMSRASDEDLPGVVRVIVEAMPHRVTVVDPRGAVLGDSLGVREFDNHLGRPEVAQALASGRGSSVRTSSTTKDERIYVARRFPSEGAPRGVVRVSMPTRGLDDTLADTYRFTEKAGALGLTAAVVLSFVAALVVSRPLRRLTEAVRAYAQGDLGHPVLVDSYDELGELADALRDLATRLAEPLAEAGSHRAALVAILEELPVGVIVYDEQGRVLTVTARARELLKIHLAEDASAATELFERPEHKAAIQEARAEDRAIAAPLLKVGGRGRAMRWLFVPGAPSRGRVVAIIADQSEAERAEELEERLREGAGLLRRAAAGEVEGALAAKLEAAADEADRAALGRRVTADQLETRDLGALCDLALEHVKARASARGISIRVELDEPSVRVVEAEGRSEQAIRRLIDAMIGEAEPKAEVRVESETGPKNVKITARTPEGRRIKAKPIAEIIHCLGGDAGSKHTGEATEAWVKIPRG